MTIRRSQEMVERDIEFDTILMLLRISSHSDAADLLHSALNVAFNNGVAAGGDQMTRIVEKSFADALTAGQPLGERHGDN